MRPAQWVKNLFVLAPLVFAERLLDPVAVRTALTTFAAFCLASSAVYLLNDVRDREEDRRHPRKRHRPVASGALPVGLALTASGTLGLAAFAALIPAGPPTMGLLAGYLALNLLYSLDLKRRVILDVMVLAIGFVLRVLGGAVAIDVAVSRWLLLCTIFLALFLAFSKRRHELELLAGSAVDQRQVLGQYSPAFLDMMINVVTASAVVSYALYATAADTVERFGSEGLVYTIPFVLYGIFRYLYLVYQRPEERNPTEAILTDLPSLLNLLLWGVAVLVIVYLL